MRSANDAIAFIKPRTDTYHVQKCQEAKDDTLYSDSMHCRANAARNELACPDRTED